jgi:hypothetical protein
MDELALENTIETIDDELRVREPFDQYYVLTETDEGPILNEKGTPDELYINRGDGVFRKADPGSVFF